MTDQLSLLLASAGTAPDPLEAALQQAQAPALPAPQEPSAGQKSKATLRGENQVLATEVDRQTRFVRILAGVSAASVLLALGTFFWGRAQQTHMLERAFKIIHYREVRALEANAVVLDDYATRMGTIVEEVKTLPGITDQERALRLKAMVAAKAQADQLRDGFLKQAQESEKDNGTGGSFSYTDPFLKRPVDFEDEMGGKLDLDQLRAEIKKSSNMDSAMEEMRRAMTNPTPLADQLAAEAKDQHAPTVGPDGVIPPSKLGAPGAGLQLPNVQLPKLPQGAPSPIR